MMEVSKKPREPQAEWPVSRPGSNHTTPEYKSEALPLEAARSVTAEFLFHRVTES
jgi:hypothetical protein